MDSIENAGISETQKEIKLTVNQELMHIRRKRLICKSDYNLKSGCT